MTWERLWALWLFWEGVVMQKRVVRDGESQCTLTSELVQ